MVKPATVENAFKKTPRKAEHHLRLVEKNAPMKSRKAVPASKVQKPEVADDLDDMWDNVPV